jgi:hypothetical protein
VNAESLLIVYLLKIAGMILVPNVQRNTADLANIQFLEIIIGSGRRRRSQGIRMLYGVWILATEILSGADMKIQIPMFVVCVSP